MRKEKPLGITYITLGLIGIIFVAWAILGVRVVPSSQACGDLPCQPNGSWTVNSSGCFSLCSCAGNLRSDTAITSTAVATMIQIIVPLSSRPVTVADVVVPAVTVPDNRQAAAEVEAVEEAVTTAMARATAIGIVIPDTHADRQALAKRTKTGLAER